MSYSYFIILAVSFVCGFSLLFTLYNTCKNTIFLKIASLIFGLIFLFRYMWDADAIEAIFKLNSEVIEGKFANFSALFLVWFTYSANLLLILYGFFKTKSYDKWILFFVLPLVILNIFCLRLNILALCGQNALTTINTKAIFYSIEVGLAFAYALSIVLKINYKLEFSKAKSKNTKADIKFSIRYKFFCKFKSFLTFIKEHWTSVACVLIIIFSTMPPYMLQGLFGKHNQLTSCLDLKFYHRLILYVGLMLPFVIHFALKSKDFKTKKFYLLFICLGTLISFSLNHRFASFADLTSWPLHLCNTAMYIMPIVLIFNMKKFFYFTYFINVVGAFFAMIMPNYSSATTLYETSLLIFYINHYIAFFMPILFVSLGMFEKPKLKQFVYSMMGFAGYFVLVLFLNALFTGMYEVGLVSSTTDFFFINSDFIADKLGRWATDLRNITFSFNIKSIKLTFYPVYQTLFFLTYIGIGVAMWFIYVQGYEIANSLSELREKNKKIKLDKLATLNKIQGGDMKQPVNPENKDKLLLIDFSKKYGNSNVFAVEKANLEVHGGEIFGFLGPNGAGKSTIIKTIVGIQPITSGQIQVCGYDVETQGIEAKSQIGFVPDHYALYEKLTGREYINYIADLYNVSKEDRDKRIANCVNKFELTTAFDNQIKTYSHGMKQKIAILSALVHNPKIWILDEPLTGLDPNSIYQVKECMKEHAKAGNVVFFSSHIIDVVEKICDRIAIIKKGHILTIKTLDEIERSGMSLEEFYMSNINENPDKKGNSSREKKQ